MAHSTGPSKTKLLFLIAEYDYFCTHRLKLAIAASNAGFEVLVATRYRSNQTQKNEWETQIQQAGIQIIPLQHFNRGDLNPLKQLLLLSELFKVYKRVKPSIAYHVAMKPVIMGFIATWWCKTPKVINALGGLGYLFTNSIPKPKNIAKLTLQKTVCLVLKRIFSKSQTLILQNPDDRNTLIQLGCIAAKQTNVVLIPGSGVDLNVFAPKTPPPTPPIIISCISRMLWDKGIGELVKAAAILKEKKLPVKVLLYGMPDSQNPASIPLQQLKAWHQAGIIEWQGHCQDVAKAYNESHIAVLASYREGMPKTLLEAAACGRPIVTTDVPGCREIVQHGINGLLVPSQNSEALASALIQLIENDALRTKMGRKAREWVEMHFSDTLINKQIMELML